MSNSKANRAKAHTVKLAPTAHGGKLDAVRRKRDALRKALEAERATRRRDRKRHAELHNRLRSAQAANRRLSKSRAAYRELALRVEAALLRAPLREDFGALEGRLDRALATAGFRMPAARDR